MAAIALVAVAAVVVCDLQCVVVVGMCGRVVMMAVVVVMVVGGCDVGSCL